MGSPYDFSLFKDEVLLGDLRKCVSCLFTNEAPAAVTDHLENTHHEVEGLYRQSFLGNLTLLSPSLLISLSPLDVYIVNSIE